jgi:hypothetical protein
MMPRAKKPVKLEDLDPQQRADLLADAIEMVLPIVLKQVREEREATARKQEYWRINPSSNAERAAARSQSYFNSTRRSKISFFLGRTLSKMFKPLGVKYTYDRYESPVHKLRGKGEGLTPPAYYGGSQ